MSNFQLKERIERMWWSGMGPVLIQKELGPVCSREYIAYVLNLQGARPIPLEERVGDHDKHLALVAKANRGRGFPVCVKPS